MSERVEAPPLRLYVLKTGYLRGTDIEFVLPNGEVEIESATWFSGCYLVQHPSGWLLWDTGLSDSLIALPNGDIHGNIQDVVSKTLASHLDDLKVKPQEIRYVAFSHVHPDHAGNVTLFTESTLLVHAREHEVAMTQLPPKGVTPKDRWAFAEGRTVKVGGDLDIFGDGSMVILEAPGHSVGHQVLLVRLPKFGPVILAGDLYYSPSDRVTRRVAHWNSDWEQSRRSMERIEKIAAESGARLIIHHCQEEIDALPQAPEFLE